MKRFLHCFLCRETWLLMLLAGKASAASIFDMELMLAPPAQSTNATCQSYVLAIALSMLDTSRFTTPQWRVNNAGEFRKNEINIRAEIEREMRRRLKRPLTRDDNSTRDDWTAVVKKITFGQFVLRQQNFVSLFELTEFLRQRLPERSSADPNATSIVPMPSTVYFTSFRRIEHSTYAGHVVSIVGIDASNVRRSDQQPALFVINSSVEGDDNECLPAREAQRRWFGSASWITDYEVKAFPGNLYILNWLEVVR